MGDVEKGLLAGIAMGLGDVGGIAMNAAYDAVKFVGNEALGRLMEPVVSQMLIGWQVLGQIVRWSGQTFWVRFEMHCMPFRAPKR